MAQRPPKRYEPGELDRTRQRLGNLSAEEARRMARVLGGQVGVERSDPGLDAKYQKIKDINRRRVDHFSQPARRATGASSAASSRRADASRPDAETRTRAGYLDRVRMDFLAARTEHDIKTFGSAMASLFSFAFSVKDRINPRFIRNADKIYFTTIENLVIAVRKLMARYEKVTQPVAKNQYFSQILTVIKDWEIERLSTEIAHLQRSPRNVVIEECAELTRLLFRPIVRLIELEPNYHVAQALKHFHDVDLLSLPKSSPDVQSVKLQYSMARDMQLRVFVDLKRRLYPLLMKLATVRFTSYSDLFGEQRDFLLAFLDLKAEEIVPAKAPSADTQSRSAEERTKQDSSEAQGEHAQEGEQSSEDADDAESAAENEEEASSVPQEFGRGLRLMDALFPQAGWRRAVEFPDMYPYFQPLFNFPRGIELVPPEDPLQQIIIFTALLQEVFYGFRGIKFGTIVDDRGNPTAVGEQIESLTGNWHLFLDELIAKSYVSVLTEYARQAERAGDSRRQSEYVEKMESDLLWTKRRYFLPKLNIKIVKGVRPSVAANIPKLSETVHEILGLLERVLADVSSGRGKSIENPNEELSFAVEGFISKRLRLILSRTLHPETFIQNRTSNLGLVFNTVLLLRSFDFLLNGDGSFYYAHYNEDDHPLFRQDPSRENVPLYNVALDNPFKIIDAAEREYVASNAPAPESSGPLDPVTHFETARALTKKLQGLMRDSEGGGPVFSVMPLSIRRFSEVVKQSSLDADALVRRAAAVVASEIRDFEDLPYRVGAGAFIIVMPQTSGLDAVHLAERLRKSFDADSERNLPVSMAIIEYRPGWSLERLLKSTQDAIREAARHPSPSVVMYVHHTERFDPIAPPAV